MTTSRRNFLKAVSIAGAAITPATSHSSDDHRHSGEHDHEHDHEHGQGHEHEHEHSDVPSDIALRVKSLESVLVEKGIVDSRALDAMVDVFENKVGPRNGAKVVARSWVDPAFKSRLLANGTKAMAEFNFSGWQGVDIRVVENTPKVHNLIVCTLCSCYPWPLLGLPPAWYKSTAYRSRAVIDPRGVLKELGTELHDDIELRVWDSTASQRYFVLPQRPQGTERFTETELAALVTRDMMIGAARVNKLLAGDHS